MEAWSGGLEELDDHFCGILFFDPYLVSKQIKPKQIPHLYSDMSVACQIW